MFLQGLVCESCLSTWLLPGDWVNGKREGRGEEASQYGQYKGNWKADLKHGYGEERSLVGTIFNGNWEMGKKNGRGVRRMVVGSVDDQVRILRLFVHILDVCVSGDLLCDYSCVGILYIWL